MTTYNTSSKLLISNYAVLQTLEPTEIVTGQSIIVSSVASAFNGTFTVLDVPLYQYIGVDSVSGALLFDGNVPRENQVLYAATGSNVSYTAIFSGTITYTQTCSWITVANLETYLGAGTITNPSDDYTLLTQATSAGNMFCYRRRQEAGYFDSLTTAPGGDATMGTLMYAAAIWRSRGSTQDTFAAFDGMNGGNVNAMTPVIKQLLGIDRPQVA